MKLGYEHDTELATREALFRNINLNMKSSTTNGMNIYNHINKKVSSYQNLSQGQLKTQG